MHLADCQKLRLRVENDDPEPQANDISETKQKVENDISILQNRQSDLRKEFDDSRQRSADDENQKQIESNKAVLKEQTVVVKHICT